MVKAGSIEPGALASMMPILSAGNEAAILGADCMGANPGTQDILAALEVTGLADVDMMFDRFAWLAPRRATGF
jgi:hypothetical protein